MIRRSLLALAPALTLAGIAAPALAQETRATATAKLDREFVVMDANGDASLSKAEVAARIGRMKMGPRPLTPRQKQTLVNLWFGRADADRNGKVTRGEARAVMGQVFRHYDRNGDGQVNRAEQGAAQAQLRRGAPAGR